MALSAISTVSLALLNPDTIASLNDIQSVDIEAELKSSEEQAAAIQESCLEILADNSYHEAESTIGDVNRSQQTIYLEAKSFADNLEDLQFMMNKLHEIVQCFGQLISIIKTEFMVVSRSGIDGMSEDSPNLTLDNIPLLKTNQFKYVGGMEQSNGKFDRDLEYKLQKMSIGYSKLDKSIFSNKNISIKIKVLFFNSSIIL